jgi:putative membrane protein
MQLAEPAMDLVRRAPMLSGRRIGLHAAAMALASAFVAGAQDDQTFIKEAVEGNLAELHLAELAAARAENPEVRKFAETLRLDHRATLQRARAVAKSLKTEPPEEPAQETKGSYDALAQLSGSQFDAAFLSHMVVAHEAEIAKYARNASSDDDAVASLVADALPKLRAHLSAAQALQRGTPAHHSP